MKKVEKRIGDFKSMESVTIPKIIQRRDRWIKTTDLRKFLQNVERGLTAYDDMILAYYDYRNGGIGSVYVYLSVNENGEDYELEYAIASEYNGDVTVEGYVSIGDEDILLTTLNNVLLANIKVFREFENEE